MTSAYTRYARVSAAPCVRLLPPRRAEKPQWVTTHHKFFGAVDGRITLHVLTSSLHDSTHRSSFVSAPESALQKTVHSTMATDGSSSDQLSDNSSDSNNASASTEAESASNSCHNRQLLAQFSGHKTVIRADLWL